MSTNNAALYGRVARKLAGKKKDEMTRGSKSPVARMSDSDKKAYDKGMLLPSAAKERYASKSAAPVAGDKKEAFSPADRKKFDRGMSLPNAAKRRAAAKRVAAGIARR